MWAGFGVHMLIFTGAMNRISKDITDAARIDGCGWFRELCRITLPIIWETVSVMLIMNIAAVFISSGPILYFTNGGLHTRTDTISFWIFQRVREGQHKYNESAAVGLFYTIAALPLVIASRALLGRLNKDVTY